MTGAANLGLRFVLELAMLAAFAYWGFTADAPFALRILLGVGAPVVAIVIWGAFIAPKAPRQLADPGRLALEVVLFGLASLALLMAGREVLALSLAVLAAGNIAMLQLSGQR